MKFINLLTLKNGMTFGRQDYQETQNQLKSALILMRKHNPVIVPYNHLVEEALLAAEDGDMKPFLNSLFCSREAFEFSASNEIFLQFNLRPNPYITKHFAEHKEIYTA